MANTLRYGEPNQFDLEGDGVSISYSTTSIAGVPQFTYQEGASPPVNRSGEEIRVLCTGDVGTLVTIDVEQVPDQYTVKLSLLLPTINLPQGFGASALETIAILTTEYTSIAGPVAGQAQTYEVLMLRGTARMVQF